MPATEESMRSGAAKRAPLFDLLSIREKGSYRLEIEDPEGS